MADQESRQRDDQSNTIKDPSDWVTGDEPMTEAQRAYLHSLSQRAGAPMDADLTKAEASERIDALRGEAGQGRGGAAGGQGVTGTPQRDPDQWVTGDEPMTGAQRSYLHTLAQQAGKSVDDNMTKAEAAKRIEELQAKTGRGQPNQGRDAND